MSTEKLNARQFVEQIVVDAKTAGATVKHVTRLKGKTVWHSWNLEKDGKSVQMAVEQDRSRKGSPYRLLASFLVDKDGQVVGSWSTWKAVRAHALSMTA